MLTPPTRGLTGIEDELDRDLHALSEYMRKASQKQTYEKSVTETNI